jgi:titin
MAGAGSGGVITYSDTAGLILGTTYYYRVKGYNEFGESLYSDIASAIPIIFAPSGLTATAVSSSQINLGWLATAISETNSYGFKIERSLTQDTGYSLIGTIGQETTSYSDTAGLILGTRYWYRVRGYNVLGNGLSSNQATTITWGAPSNLVITAVSSSQINLSWAETATNETGFKIERSIDGTTLNWVQIATVGENVTLYSDTDGLILGTKYWYRVKAYNALGDSLPSNPASTTTWGAPTSSGTTSISSSEIIITWTDTATNELGFKIERSIDNGQTWAEIATVGADTASYSDTTDLILGTTYKYRVRAFNALGDGAYSTPVSCATKGIPGSLNGMFISPSSVSISWTDTATNEDGFKIERAVYGVSDFAQLATVGAEVEFYSDTAIAPGMTYSYQVRAFNALGNSGYSNTKDVTVPGTPQSLTATIISSSQIVLTWTDIATNEDGFKIERSTNGGYNYALLTTLNANTTSYSDTAVSSGNTYHYQVRAYNAYGSSPQSNNRNITIIPIAPSALTATAFSPSQINLSWTNVNGEAGYKIERSIITNTNYSLLTTPGANITLYSDTPLTPGTTFYYKVKAYNAGGESPFSPESSATTTFGAPLAPILSNVTAISPTELKLEWVGVFGADGYKVERSFNGSNYALLSTLNADMLSYSDTTVTPNNMYYYRVIAYNAYGDSAYSNVISRISPSLSSFRPLAGDDVPTQTGIDDWKKSVGYRFKSSVNGYIGALGRYIGDERGIENTTVILWDDDWMELARVTVSTETGWAWQNLTTPIYITAGTWYRVSVSCPSIFWYNDIPQSIERSYIYIVSGYVSENINSYPNEEYGLIYGWADIEFVPECSAPTTLTAVALINQVNLTWTDTSNSEEGFKIERSDVSSVTGYSFIATVVGQDITSYSDTTVEGGTYYYRVRAYSAFGISQPSNIANATITPTAPANLAATAISYSRIDLEWIDVVGETGYKIERKTGAGGTYAQIETVPAGVVTYSNTTGLVPETEYYYKVRAYNTGGNGDYSNVISATTPACRPLSIDTPPADSYNDGGGVMSAGYRFKPLVNGAITALGRYIGYTSTGAANITVILWGEIGDGTTGTELGRVTVPANLGWRWAYLATPIPVTAGAYYRVSVICDINSGSGPGDYWYSEFSTSPPVTRGNIQINSCCYDYGTDVYPSVLDTYWMEGWADIEFLEE